MNSSVTISNELRKKIKMLAAKLDSTQGEIVEQAIELFEENIQEMSSYKDNNAREFMKKATTNNPNLQWRKEIREKLKAPGADLEEFKIELNDKV